MYMPSVLYICLQCLCLQCYMPLVVLYAFGALTLLVGHQEEHLACKNE